MSTQGPTRDAPLTNNPPQTNGSAHPKSPEPHPHSERDGEAPESKEAPGPRHNSKQLRPMTTDELRDKIKDKKGKLADRKEQLKRMSKPPGGFDPTPLPDAPQGYT